MTSRKEKRQFQRWDCIMPCRCEGKGFRAEGCIVNLSYGGAGIAGTKRLPEVDSELLLTIRPATERIELRSRVVWVKSDVKDIGKAHFGVEFCETAQETGEKLKGYFPGHYIPEILPRR